MASAILTPNGAWRVREYKWNFLETRIGEKPHRDNNRNFSFQDAMTFRMVSSEGLEVIRRNQCVIPEVNEKAVDSTLKLWGKYGQEILNNLVVGIAGLGGVGSILVEFLARLGIGQLILVDFDLVQIENLNRLVGVRLNEVGKSKAKYAARIAKNAATSKQFRVTSFSESVSEESGLVKLLDADIIMNAADSAFARQVLDHVSYAYEIPVIDGGSTFVPQEDMGRMRGKSQVSVSGPGFPCLECSGVYNQEEATLAREDPESLAGDSYIKASGKPYQSLAPRNPSVISYNGLVASIMIQRMLSLTLGFPPERRIGQQRYYVEEGVLNWGPIGKCNAECQKESWIGLGNSHYVPTGLDPLWKKIRGLKS